MKHFISVEQLTEIEIFNLIRTAEYYRNHEIKYNKQLFAANLFFEPSTRTKSSFMVAERKLGMELLDFIPEVSSVQKGESLYDTAKTFEAIGADMLVIRHEADDWYEQIEGLSIPVINAGAGKAEHPTQCLLDLLTIYQEFGGFEGLNIAIAGDIKHSRVAKSNAQALQRLGVRVYLVPAYGYEDPDLVFPYITMDEAVEICDAIMLLRVQYERHTEYVEITDYLQEYGLTKEREKRMKDHAIIMHPAPVNRGVEIDPDLVECERSRIFKQMNNGVYIRMAIISSLLEKWGICNEDNLKERKSLTRVQ